MNELAHTFTTWDRAAFLAINHSLKCPALDWLAPRITNLGLGYVQALAVLCIAVIMGMRAREIRWDSERREVMRAIFARRAWVGPLLVCFALSGLTADTVKKVFPGERPWWFYEGEHRAGRELDTQVYTVPGVYPLKYHRFPSGHTATTAAMATVVTLLYARRRKRRALVLGVWAMVGLVGLSRIYLASHWPLDVLGGGIIGVVFGVISLEACRVWALRRHTPVVDSVAVEKATGTN